MYTIQCDTITQLAFICASLVKDGICFKADARTLLIECTGGY